MSDSPNFDVHKLADLTRIKLSKKEEEEFSKEFESILNYVDQIKNVDIKRQKKVEDSDPLLNVFREDVINNESGKNTEKLLSLSPDREGNHIKVKKIL